MGNTINVKHKGDKCREITEEEIQDLGEQIRLVDGTMCGFAKTLDSFKAACELFLRQCDNRYKTQKESQENDDGLEKFADEEELAVHLLKMLDDSVSYQKRSTMESLAKLLRSLIEAGESILGNVDEKVIELSLDKYMTRRNEDENTKERLPYYAVRIEDLRKEVTIANKLNDQCKDEIIVLEERNRLSKKETDILREAKAQMVDKMKSLENEKAEIEQKMQGLQTDLQEIKMENDSLKKTVSIINTDSTNTSQLNEDFGREQHVTLINPTVNFEVNTLKTELERMKSAKESLEAELNTLKSMQLIHVQIMDKAYSVKPVEELLQKIKDDFETPSGRMYIINTNFVVDIKDDIPLIVLCPQQSAFRAIEDIKGLHRVALVVLHRVSTPSCIRTSEFVYCSAQFKKLSGIFDIAYDFDRGIYECDLNRRNINGIV